MMTEEIQLIDPDVMNECLELMGESASLILEKYFNQCTGFIKELQACTEEGKIAELAHSLKACSYQLGFHRVGRFAEMAELQAKNIEISPYGMEDLIANMTDAFESSKQFSKEKFPDLDLVA